MTFYTGSRLPDYDLKPKQKICHHRWDHLKIIGGWGEGGVISMHCSNCDVPLAFDIAEGFLGLRTKGQQEFFNAKAVKFNRRARAS